MIKDITLYTDPTQYIAIEDDTEVIYEVRISDLLEYIFKQDGNLYKYYQDNSFNYIDLYQDLISLGYPLLDKIEEYMWSEDKDYISIPVPKGIYPIVRKYYKGVATEQEKFILSLYLGQANMPDL